MKIILAGAESKNHADLLAEEKVVNPMISFARIKIVEKFREVSKLFDTKLIVDSGAFSAHNLRIEVGLYDYCHFIKRVHKHVEFYFNLDVIYNPVKTSENQLKMENEGLNPIPVFHYYEKNYKFEYLEEYCKKYDLVGLGGIASSTINFKWLDKCFKILKEHKTKAHGLGVGSPIAMKKFDWFSCDTTDWLNGSTRNEVFVPCKDFLKRVKANRPEWLYIAKPMIEHLGISYGKLNEARERDRLNIRSFKLFEKKLNQKSHYWC